MKTLSACSRDCPGACSLIIEDDGRGPRVRGNPEHPFGKGLICSKGARHFQRLAKFERVTEPLLRRNGRLTPIAWDEALDLCAERLNALRSEPERVLHMRGNGYRGVLAEASLVFFEEYGASATRGALCDEAGIAACLEDFGALAHNDLRDLGQARRIVNWGRDLSRSGVHTAALVRQARKSGGRVLTVSPGGDGNAPFSDETIRVRPGTDRFLALATLRVLLDSNGLDEQALSRTANWPTLRALIESASPGELCAACGLGPDAAERLADWYRERPTATLLGWGLQRHLRGGETVRFINALAMATGQIGRSGGGAYFNVSSARFFVPRWGRARREPARTLLLPDLAAETRRADPPLDMVWIDGTNVVNQIPDSRAMAQTLESAPFVVAVDAVLNDTTSRADLVLPCALMCEREDVMGSFHHGFLTWMGRAVQPPGQAREDFDLLADLGRRLDPPIVFPDPEECLRAGLSRLPDPGAALETLRGQGWIEPGEPTVAFEGLRFGHPDGLYRFPEALHPEPQPDRDYPLRLLSLVRGEHLHSQIPPVEQDMPPVVEVSPDCPCLLGLDQEQPVFLETPRGRLRVRLSLDGGLHPEALVYRRGDWMLLGGGVNQLIAPLVTDLGENAAYYSQGCRLVNRGLECAASATADRL